MLKIKHIYTKITVPIILMITLVLILSGVYRIREESIKSTAAFNNKAEITISLASHSISEILWNLNDAEMASIGSAFLNDPEVIGITIIDDREKPLYSNFKKNSDIKKAVLFEKSIKKISSDTEIIGKIKIYLTKEVYEEAIKKDIFTSVVVLIVTWILVLLIISIVSIYITKPIKLLQATVIEFANKNLLKRAPVLSIDEIGVLSKNFNNMADIIEEYSKNLEKKVEERTNEALQKTKEILESIEYAKRIQQTILPDMNEEFFYGLKDYFIIWTPRDIVGGDFYWSKQENGKTIILLCDCTGHGVPGALMTMLLNAIFDRVIDGNQIIDPALILKESNKILKTTLNQDNENAFTNDGADVGICTVDTSQKRIVFAGARIILFMCKDGEITEFKGNKMSLGDKKATIQYEFTNNEFDNCQEAIFYMTSDGFIDQCGGPKNIPFGIKRFKSLILENYQKPLNEQKKIFVDGLNDYMGENSQIDDITLIAFSIN